MKITSFSPYIVAKNKEEVLKMFEKLGFEKRHEKMDANSGKNPSITMKNADGFMVSFTESNNIPQDLMAIRINVDNFDEAYKTFTDMGFVNPQGDGVVANSSSDKAAMLFAPTGFAVMICEHFK